MPSEFRQRPLLPALAGIRFFAAIHVCLHHLAQMAYALKYYPTAESAKLQGWGSDLFGLFAGNWITLAILKGALIQVGMFFVMSGFILTYSHPVGPQGQFSRRDYFLARVARVYAMYAIGLIVTIPIFLFLGWGIADKPEAKLESRAEGAVLDVSSPIAPVSPASTLRSKPPQMTYTTTDRVLATVATPLLMQAWFPRLSIFPWNPPAWSLSVEAFAYLVFPLLVVPMTRWSTRSLVLFGGCCWVAMLVAPIWYVLANPDNHLPVEWNANLFWFNFVRHNPILRLPEFLIGMAIGRMFSEQAAENARSGKGTGGWMSVSAVLAVIVTLIFAEKILGPDLAYMLLHNGLLAPVFALGLVGLALGGGPVHAICSRATFVLLGESAYAIYMLHFPVLAYTVAMMVDNANKKGEMPQSPIRYTIFFLVVVTLLSVATHKWWELPWRRQIRHLMIRLWPDPRTSSNAV